ncbi:MAG: hypothetical protein NUV54_02830, partial [Candidatus Taylorbacteria bacterium]|nr:hypothetical protein [Candidatus Taylorbacteria bacterium]
KRVSLIGDPRVTITKCAKDNPLTFTIVVSVLPEVTLPDYKKIASSENAKKPEVVEVTDKELDDFIKNILTGYAKSTAKEGETQELPTLDDTFVKKLGDFKDVADFKAKVKENLLHEKQHKAKEKKRLMLAEAVLKKTDVSVPKALIESELAKMFARFHDDIARTGMKVEDYLKHIKKTEEDMRKEWRPDAEKRGKLQLVWNAIAEAEKITVPPDELEVETKHMLEQYKTADPGRTRAYVSMMLTNEKVFDFLESQK